MNAPSLQSICSESRRAIRGFTLIEVLLAVVIFSIVLVAIHTVFYGALQLRNRTSQSVLDGLPLQQALAVMKRDLNNIVMPGGTFCGEFQTSQSMTSSTNTLDLLNPIDEMVIGQSSPAFFTATGIISDTVPWGDIQRVSYILAPPTNNTPGKDLVRLVTRNLLPTLQEEPERQWLLSGVQSMAFSFYDGLQWREYWDSTVETNRLPLGIKVELQLVDHNNSRSRRPPVTLVVPVVLQAGTNETSIAEGGEE